MVQRILPVAAYLEMARVAVSKSCAQLLKNRLWSCAMSSGRSRSSSPRHKQISIALLANDDDEIDYEIYSQEADEEIVHCQGRAVLSREPASARLDLEQLKR